MKITDKKDPVYYRDRINELIDMAKENGIEVSYKCNVIYGSFLLFSDLGTTVSIALDRFHS